MCLITSFVILNQIEDIKQMHSEFRNNSTRAVKVLCSTVLFAAIGTFAGTANAFTVYTNQANYDAALTAAGLTTTLTETFPNRIQASNTGDSITFDSGIISSIINSSNTNQNRVNGGAEEFQGNLRDDPTNREITWTLPTMVDAFSLRIQGASQGQNLAIRGLFNGSGGGEQTENLSDLFGNASYQFLGIVGMGTFDSFTFFDASPGSGSNAFNFKVDDFSAATPSPTTVPTPALLPGLIGFGMSIVRKRKQQNNSLQEA